MLDIHTDMVKALSSVLPTYPEFFLRAGIDVPCISYMELNNYVSVYADKLAYSTITYQVKVWANTIEEIQRYSLEVDQILRPLGWRRISSGELYDNQSTMIQKIMTYEALASETY